jgi:hypothetical protein
VEQSLFLQLNLCCLLKELAPAWTEEEEEEASGKVVAEPMFL